MNINEIHFHEGDPTLSYYESQYWNLNETRQVEFFTGNILPVTLISVINPNLESYLNKLTVDPEIALDLEWTDELCLFQFCSSAGVLIIRHPKGTGNETLKNFLKTHKFYGKGTRNDKKQLNKKFGDSFEENIEDIAQTRLVPYGNSENFISMTLQFAGKPAAAFKDLRITTSNWEQEVLTIRQVLYAAFDVVSLFKCYPNYPAPMIMKKKNKIKTDKRIRSSCKPNNEEIKEKKKEKSVEIERIKMIPNLNINRFCYILPKYIGCLTQKKLRDFFDINKDDTEFISYFPNGDGSYQIYLSLFNEYNKISKLPELQEIPKKNPSDYSDGDILFITNIPERIHENKEFEKFLFLFERDHKLIFNLKHNYVMVILASASSSHLLNTFLPNITIDNEKLKVNSFPFFLNTIFISNLKPDANEKYLRSLFSEFGAIKKARFFIKRNDNDPCTASIQFTDKDSSAKAIQKMNYKEVDGETLYVSRYTREVHLRILRLHCIFDEAIKNNEELYQTYSKFGEIHQCYYDKRLDISYVQFYSKAVTKRALQNIKTGYLRKEGTTIILREVSCSLTNDEVITLCEQFGRVLLFVNRLIIPKFRYQVFEVTFSTPEEATNARKSLDHKIIDSIPINVSFYQGSGSEVPMWKMEYRFNWISIPELLDEEDIYNNYSKFGSIIDFNHSDNKTFIMYYSRNEAEQARKSNKNITMPTIHEYGYFSHNPFFETETYTPKSLEYDSSFRKVIFIEKLPKSFIKPIIDHYCPNCHYKFASFPSLTNQEEQCGIIYPSSQKMTKKIYALLRGQVINNEELKLVVKNINDLPELYKSKTIIIDPLPEELYDNNIKRYIIGDINVTIYIIPSTMIKDAKKAVLIPNNCTSSERREIVKNLNRYITNTGEKLQLQKLSMN